MLKLALNTILLCSLYFGIDANVRGGRQMSTKDIAKAKDPFLVRKRQLDQGAAGTFSANPEIDEGLSGITGVIANFEPIENTGIKGETFVFSSYVSRIDGTVGELIGSIYGKCTTTEEGLEPNHMCSFELQVVLEVEFVTYFAWMIFSGEMSFANGGGGFLPVESLALEGPEGPQFEKGGLVSFTYTTIQDESAAFQLDFSP